MGTDHLTLLDKDGTFGLVECGVGRERLILLDRDLVGCGARKHHFIL